MPRLIIGHTEPDRTKIWVRGSKQRDVAFLELREHGAGWQSPIAHQLEPRHFWTGVIDVGGLKSDTRYYCRVRFGRSARVARQDRKEWPDSEGSFRTPPGVGQVNRFGFLFGSCNLHSIFLNPPKPAYRRLSKLAREKSASFMIHCGDQIYADVPFPPRVNLDYYREKYLDAWEDCETARAFLTELPQYMILDDHEIRNNFHNDIDDDEQQFVKDSAIKVYREFQHIHNPQTYGSENLHYSFDWAHASFFVMDTRTERYIRSGPQMIDEGQLEDLFDWLARGAADQPKFVVSSVPFVGEVRNSHSDKWNSEPFLAQRHAIIDQIVARDLKNVFFLTGDMHNSYCARMEVTRPRGSSLLIHELMSSPINQLGKNKLSAYISPGPPRRTGGGNTYVSTVDKKSFFGGHSNAMHVRVSGSRVAYGIYRTKKNRKAEKEGSVQLA